MRQAAAMILKGIKCIGILFLVLLCVLLLLVQRCCSNYENQRYVCTVEDVVSVQIAEFGDYNALEDRFEFIVLCEVVDAAMFMEEVNRMEMEHPFCLGDPPVLNEDEIVIIVNYRNGNSDLLQPYVQLLHYPTENKYDYFMFDISQFNALVYTNYILED